MILKEKEQSNIIVSFTSFGNRIYSAHKAIDLMLSGDVLPKKVVFSVHKDDSDILEKSIIFKKYKSIIDFNISEIEYTSHLKYIYTFEKYDDPVLLIDDDIEYTINFLKMFYYEHKKHPDKILTTDTRIFSVPFEYNKTTYQWYTNWGGVLYPHPIKDEKLKEYALKYPKRDDEVLTVLSMKNNIERLVIDENRYNSRLSRCNRVNNEFVVKTQMHKTSRNSDDIKLIIDDILNNK